MFATTLVPPVTSHTVAAFVPPGVTPSQWAELSAELSQQSDGEAELKRLADYFVYADALTRFRELERSDMPVSPELTKLARELDTRLADRLQHKELSVHEAERVKLAVLKVLLPDSAQQQHQLALWRHAQGSALIPDAEASAREAGFQHQQAAIVAAWSGLPPAQRDPKLLEEQLDMLRRTSFGTRDR